VSGDDTALHHPPTPASQRPSTAPLLLVLGGSLLFAAWFLPFSRVLPPTTLPHDRTNCDAHCSPTTRQLFPGIQPICSSSCSPYYFLKMHFKPFQTVLVAFALVARSIASNGGAVLDQCHSTSPLPPLLDQALDGIPSTAPSTLPIWSERLLSLLDPNDRDHPKGRLRAFANDLHLAFAAQQRAARPSHRRRKRQPDSGLLKRADTQKVTKCRVHSNGLGPSNGNGGPKPTTTTLPGMTPTDSNGRPLPTQTVSEGHGGSGRETIAVSQPCGNITVGATSKVQYHL
jgi:hypothetical protein